MNRVSCGDEVVAFAPIDVVDVLSTQVAHVKPVHERRGRNLDDTDSHTASVCPTANEDRLNAIRFSHTNYGRGGVFRDIMFVAPRPDGLRVSIVVLFSESVFCSTVIVLHTGARLRAVANVS